MLSIFLNLTLSRFIVHCHLCHISAVLKNPLLSHLRFLSMCALNLTSLCLLISIVVQYFGKQPYIPNFHHETSVPFS